MPLNKIGFILYVPLCSRLKNLNIKQDIWVNIVYCWFSETSIQILRLISKPPPYNYDNLPSKFQWWFRKTNTVIYYLYFHCYSASFTRVSHNLFKTFKLIFQTMKLIIIIIISRHTEKKFECFTFILIFTLIIH